MDQQFNSSDPEAGTSGLWAGIIFTIESLFLIEFLSLNPVSRASKTSVFPLEVTGCVKL